jgi:hypothetical protein
MQFQYIFVVMLAHWLADFVMQTDEMAKKKSTSPYWLSRHIFSYSTSMALSLILFWVFLWDFTLIQLIVWVVINAGLHGLVDQYTSRMTAELHRRGDIHGFFVVVGLDQFIHLVCLLGTFQLMVL